MDNDKSSNLKKLIIGTALAATAGYIAGVLTAPKSGKETREDIKAAATKKREDAVKELKHLQEELDKVIDQSKARMGKLSTKAKEELQAVVSKAKNTKEKTGEVIQAVRHGDAEDADLKRAVSSAQSSIENLREYLRK
ncbi:MAG: YtxH domain-containing protein [Candidatus Saccharimonadales bacterium]